MDQQYNILIANLISVGASGISYEFVITSPGQSHGAAKSHSYLYQSDFRNALGTLGFSSEHIQEIERSLAQSRYYWWPNLRLDDQQKAHFGL